MAEILNGGCGLRRWHGAETRRLGDASGYLTLVTESWEYGLVASRVSSRRRQCGAGDRFSLRGVIGIEWEKTIAAESHGVEPSASPAREFSPIVSDGKITCLFDGEIQLAPVVFEPLSDVDARVYEW